MVGDVQCEFDSVVLGFLALTSNNIVCPRRSVLVSDIFLRGVEVYSFSIDASFTGFGSFFVLRSDVTSTFGLYSVALLVSQLIDAVFRISSWLILAYWGPTLIARYGPVWWDRSLEYAS